LISGVAARSGADLRRQAELGRLLTDAEGYRVLTEEGRQLGLVEHVRYRRHADHPDEIVVHRRSLRKRRLVVPFEAVTGVDRRSGTVRLGAIRSNSSLAD